jgi:hypothetical protein
LRKLNSDPRLGGKPSPTYLLDHLLGSHPKGFRIFWVRIRKVFVSFGFASERFSYLLGSPSEKFSSFGFAPAGRPQINSNRINR